METSEQRITSRKCSRTNIFKLYMLDLPSTAAKVFQYSDDIAVTYQAKTFDECENNLEADSEVLNQFFQRWCLQPNPGKTEMCGFHLKTHAAKKQLDVMFNSTSIKHVNSPKHSYTNIQISPRKDCKEGELSS
jgi:hypothetical protein